MAQTHRYSLADYTVSIKFSNTNEINIGGSGELGEGTFVGSISVSFEKAIWATESDPTGSWIHNKNLAKNGTISIKINQISDDVLKLISACWAYYNSSDDECSINILKGTNQIWNAESCFINKMPEQMFSETGSTQDWKFTCGKITPASYLTQNNR